MTFWGFILGAVGAIVACAKDGFLSIVQHRDRPDVLRKTQLSVRCRTEPSRWSARFYIGALCNSAIKLAAPQTGPRFFVCAAMRKQSRRKRRTYRRLCLSAPNNADVFRLGASLASSGLSNRSCRFVSRWIASKRRRRSDPAIIHLRLIAL